MKTYYNKRMRLTKEQFAKIEHLMPIPRRKPEVSNYKPVHIESKSTQKRVDMRNNTHSFSVNSFYLIVF